MIYICDSHDDDYVVPMIHTMAFMGAELWCPYCGHTAGWPFGAERVEETEELTKRHDLYRTAVDKSEFLHAMGIRCCSGTTWPHGSGIIIKPEDLPEEEKQRLAEIRHLGWLYHRKAEEIEV